MGEAQALDSELLKAGDHLGAAKLYHASALLAMGPLEGGVLDAFIKSLESWPEDTPQCALASNEDLLWRSIVRISPSRGPRGR